MINAMKGKLMEMDLMGTSIDIVAEEEVLGGLGVASHLEQLHQIVELAMNVTTHCSKTMQMVGITRS